MTTFDPGASVVFTHGLRLSPRSTAFFASSPAPIITEGFDVLVHDVMAAIVTAPWSRANAVPSASVMSTGLLGRAALRCGLFGDPLPALVIAGGSDAGKLSAIDWSIGPRTDASASPST